MKRQRTEHELKAVVAMLIQTIQTSDLSCDDLLLVSSEINHQYALKANEVVQNFPPELWGTVFSCLSLLPMPDLLNFRTVCQSWNNSVFLVPKLNIPEHVSISIPSFTRFCNSSPCSLITNISETRWT